MKINIRHIFFVVFTVFSISLSAQTQKQFLTAGNDSFEKGNYYEAIFYFQQALKFKPNEEAQYLIALSFYELKEYQKSTNEFKKVSNQKDFPLSKFYLANSYKLQGNYNKAIEEFENFKNYYRTEGFFQQKAIQEIQSCYWALDQIENDSIEIIHFKKPINTPYSDFAASFMLDSNKLIVSSLTPKNTKNVQSEFVSKLYMYEQSQNIWKKSNLPLPYLSDYEHIANSFFLNEKNENYFTGCNTLESYIKCDIYVAKWKNENWSEITKLNINDSIYTTTQPAAYVDFDGLTKLLFTSNRNNTFNNTDIYISKELSYGKFSAPEKLPNTINTIDNESTPFFDKETQILYFSSEWHYGFGGFDIFSSQLVNNNWTKPKNLGYPINSSAHDQYYYQQIEDIATFSSNRTGSMQLKGAACCFDVFQTKLNTNFSDSNYLVVNENEISKSNDELTLNFEYSNNASDTDINNLQSLLPAIVYFHNDEPEPKTTHTKTKLNYQDSYNNYQNVKDDYYQNFSNKQELDIFFEKNVDQGFKNLQKFSEQLLNELEKGKKIQLTLEGYCSPLALNDYNINLAKRRIVNLQNYLLSWKSDALRPYFNQGYLTFLDAPFGEEKAPEGISDSLLELDKSVYSPKAAEERKVAIILVNVEK